MTRLGSARINTWLRLDVTNSVAAMVAGNAPNYGFAVASDPTSWPEGATPEGLRSARFGFATTEFFDASKAGYLRIFFRTYD